MPARRASLSGRQSMNLHVYRKALRNLRNVAAINYNRAMGREFVPKRGDFLCIETSSVCNLACCFCPYVKKQSPKVTMKTAFFKDCVQQAVELGCARFELTPCTGDVFMDRTIFDKLEFLDQHPDVGSYRFFTNFTILRPRDIERLVRLKKLDTLSISVYGSDLATFVAIARSPEKIYHRLVANLEHLLRHNARRKFDLTLNLNSGRRSLWGHRSEMLTVLGKFKRAGVPVKVSKRVYNNWGGYITNDDVKGLPMTVVGEDAVYKNGACFRLFTSVQVMATGIVNGCVCRDADATLRLGDLNQAPLRDILSPRNPLYLRLIDDQQRGKFQPVCQSCDFYGSIYRNRSLYRKEGFAVQTLEEFRAGAG